MQMKNIYGFFKQTRFKKNFHQNFISSNSARRINMISKGKHQTTLTNKSSLHCMDFENFFKDNVILATFKNHTKALHLVGQLLGCNKSYHVCLQSLRKGAECSINEDRLISENILDLKIRG